MRFCSLGSGSRGNGTIVQSSECSVLIDCGFPFKELSRRLAARQLHAEDLDAILVTHEHGDHWRGVGVAARKLNIPVYLTKGTYRVVREEKVPELEFFNCHQSFQLGDLTVHPFPVPHDAAEAAQFVFEHKGSRLGVATDLGSVSAHVSSMLNGCDALLMEFNHDEQMLRDGPYSHSLKRRVGGDYGHLNNRQAQELLDGMDKTNLNMLVAAHLSEQNNLPDKVRSCIQELGIKEEEYQIADQNLGTNWIDI